MFFNLLCEESQFVITDGAPLTRFPHASNDFITRERLNYTRTLNDLEGRSLKRGESLFARRAFPSPPDRGAIIRNTRIDDARIGVVTEGAMHPLTLRLIVTIRNYDTVDQGDTSRSFNESECALPAQPEELPEYH